MARILFGVLFLLIGSCNGLQALGDRNVNAAVGGGFIALILILLGVALLVSGFKGYRKPVASMSPSDESTRKKCPFCAEFIKTEAVVCRFCGRDVPEFKPNPTSAYYCSRCNRQEGYHDSTGRIVCPNCKDYVVRNPVTAAKIEDIQDDKTSSVGAFAKRSVISWILVVVILIVGVVWAIFYSPGSRDVKHASETGSSSDSNIPAATKTVESVTDEQIYREFERCMNSAKEYIDNDKLEARRQAAYCITRLAKYGDARAKKAFNIYYNLD